MPIGIRGTNGIRTGIGRTSCGNRSAFNARARLEHFKGVLR